MNKKGFTLLEILLVIAAIGVLAAIVIVAINPTRQLGQVRNAERQSELNALYNALLQYSIDNGGLPDDIPVGSTQSDYGEICRQGVLEADCTTDGLVYIEDDLVPTYIPAIPEDPTRADVTTPNGTGYEVRRNIDNNLFMGVRTIENDLIISLNDDTYDPIVSSVTLTQLVRNPGSLYTWGENVGGQIGNGNTTDQQSPLQIGSDTDWVFVEGEERQSYAVKQNGTLWATGWNSNGELGDDGDTTDKTVFEQSGSDTNWLEVAAGNEHAAGLKTDGTIVTWGSDFYGELGDGVGETPYNATPTQMGTDTDWVRLDTGRHHSIALKTDATLWGWGYNYQGGAGQLGGGELEVPTQIGTDSDWIQIAAGEYHSLGLKADGTLWAWGDNSDGQIGDGTTTNRFSPVQVGTDTDWAFVTAKNYHSVGIKTDGTLWAWGWNWAGQLGDGTTTSRSVPTQIGSDTDWETVSAGLSSTIATKTNGTLWGWGENGDGQIGDGTTTDRLTPVQAGSSTNWESIGTGYWHSLGIQN